MWTSPLHTMGLGDNKVQMTLKPSTEQHIFCSMESPYDPVQLQV